MSLKGLKENHLASPEHAPPSSVTFERRANKGVFQVVSVRKPADAFKGVYELVVQPLHFVFVRIRSVYVLFVEKQGLLVV
jgi:hypothetical protein